MGWKCGIKCTRINNDYKIPNSLRKKLKLEYVDFLFKYSNKLE